MSGQHVKRKIQKKKDDRIIVQLFKEKDENDHSDDELDDFIRAHVESAYHPCGTCRMGRSDDKEAVVDPHGRVIGVGALRVVDSSVFPRITNGNLNAPSIMVGERAADIILEDARAG